MCRTVTFSIVLYTTSRNIHVRFRRVYRYRPRKRPVSTRNTRIGRLHGNFQSQKRRLIPATPRLWTLFENVGAFQGLLEIPPNGGSSLRDGTWIVYLSNDSRRILKYRQGVFWTPRPDTDRLTKCWLGRN